MGIHDEASATDESLRKVFAPEGWHVPTEDEMEILKSYLIANGYNLDGTNTGIIKNKVARSIASNSGWRSDSVTGTPGNNQTDNNRSGFNAYPWGYRNGSYGGDFSYLVGESVYFWTSTESSSTGAFSWGLRFDDIGLSDGASIKGDGYSVRFVRD